MPSYRQRMAKQRNRKMISSYIPYSERIQAEHDLNMLLKVINMFEPGTDEFNICQEDIKKCYERLSGGGDGFV